MIMSNFKKGTRITVQGRLGRTTLRRLLLGNFSEKDFDDLEKELVEFFKDAIGMMELEDWQLNNVKEIASAVKKINDLSYGIADY